MFKTVCTGPADTETVDGLGRILTNGVLLAEALEELADIPGTPSLVELRFDIWMCAGTCKDDVCPWAGGGAGKW